MSYEIRRAGEHGPARMATFSAFATAFPVPPWEPLRPRQLTPERRAGRGRPASSVSARPRTLWDAMRGSWGAAIRA